MWMNLKNNVGLLINEDMRYLLVDRNYNPNAWDDVIKAMSSESYHVEHSSNSDLITYLKANIKDIDFDDLLPLYDAVTDNERFGRHMMTDAEMLELINGDHDDV